MSKLRLYLDEDIPASVSAALRSRGYDVVSARDMTMLGATDADQLGVAISNQRALVTRNVKDFVRLHEECVRANKSHHGIIVTRKIKIGEFVHHLASLLETKRSEDLKDILLWI